MQLQVLNSPFNEEQAELLNRVLPTLTETQKIWLSGYLAASQPGFQTEGSSIQLAEVPAQNRDQSFSKEITILFGSQTGNAKSLAVKAGKILEEKGFKAIVSVMSDFKPNNLKKIENLLVVVSTQGEGDPPDNAIAFHEFLNSRRAPKLEGLRFSVLALGDTSYEQYCQVGKEFDLRLEELGGARLYSRVDCDLDFDEPAAEWLDGVLDALSQGQREQSGQEPASTVSQEVESIFSRSNPFRAEVLENLCLNGRGSNKETRHLELSLEGSGITFLPGDSLGIYPENDPALVDLLIQEMKWDPEEIVTINKKGEVSTLKEALTAHFEITVLTKPLLKSAAELTVNEELKKLIAEDEGKLRSYLGGRDLLDLIRDYGPWSGTAQDFISILRKMPARLYSIASSLKAYPDEVHLTIGSVRYDSLGRKRNGVCSILCAERLKPGDTLPVYIQHNDQFKLAEDPSTPVIMVGPGTGIAPFRAFMQEREETGADGKSWLFFGDQHFRTDFLYQTEWQKWIEKGVLTRMDVAFSRDTDHKVYVQHRMLEHSSELFKWLEEGAAVYICGDEKNMAHDVHQTLLEIIEKEGRMSNVRAQEYLAGMQQQKRYLRDVY
ncbi:assimilatory sulfite reductase (NADPH) flavoprotein subunit [Heyndrickxia acidicola]|uniref:Assimilatory sulfite reductase (NADPH) flavoprotein subunit n=1 Tax=Heyndrickxia acidicola TaxID=209389 RepID=A0ABU6MRT9_9BACI|nr:assimilatory sulfite reductase (NADPH) flavoprotein subunit [Heyndrickxia acidicola]MED1205755.1 assimilatory sulfite reductase (NADPH) flavoprotein subunit [Heyndrickxia acidicola]